MEKYYIHSSLPQVLFTVNSLLLELLQALHYHQLKNVTYLYSKLFCN